MSQVAMKRSNFKVEVADDGTVIVRKATNKQTSRLVIYAFDNTELIRLRAVEQSVKKSHSKAKRLSFSESLAKLPSMYKV